MIPYLVTAPTSLPVELGALKLHLRVAHDDDDADITAKQAGAVAALDAWGGMLGRCIMPQTWAIDVIGPGPHLLPFPDAENVSAESDSVEIDTEITRTGLGLCVSVPVALLGQAITITAVYALPEPRLAAAQTLVKLMVQREYDIMAGADYDAMTRSIDALIGAMRVRRL